MTCASPEVLKLLVLTSLYPNSVQPRHGIFVEERLRALMSTGAVAARVVAPVPWFPFKHERFGRYADFAAVPAREVRYGVEVLHPRYPVLPRIGMTLGPAGMAAAVAPVLRRMRAQGDDFDLIDAHYLYPDGVAAAILGRRFRRPVVITARGTDVNTIAHLPVPRRQIMRAARRSAAIIAVSRALKDVLVRLGVAQEKITVLRNGVDTARFAPVAQDAARVHLGVTGPVWLAVGNLVELKGVHVAIEALAQAPDVTLLIVGQGPEEGALRALAARRGVSEQVRFVGYVPHEHLPEYYSAADALVLAARSEGMPNVVLEALACGTAVIGTAVGGIPELVDDPVAGALMDDRTPESIIEAWQTVCGHGTGQKPRNARRRHAERLGWDETSRGQLALFRRILGPEDALRGANSAAVEDPAHEAEE